MNSKLALLLFFLTLFLPYKTLALPIDWHGVLGFDTTSIDNYRRIDSKTDSSSLGNANSRGTQEVPLGPGDNANANWQSYIFRLEPTLIVNDAATIKGELTSGYARGGNFGDDNSVRQEPGFGNSLYQYNFSSGSDSIVLNKIYAELYSDTATYIIGRQSSHYGLGAVVNSGDNPWDRFSFTRDGVTAKIKIGNFAMEPFWARTGSNGSLTKSTRTKEIGFVLDYDNVERDLGFGLLYSVKKSAPFASDYIAGTDQDTPTSSSTYSTTYSSLGKTNVKLTDLFIRKEFGNFGVALEVPILSGEVGTVFGSDTKYKSRSFIFESHYKASDSLKLTLDAGKVAGDDGAGDSFTAMYLNPNYQIANLLFRYNLRAMSNPTGTNARSAYDSYINNATYAKLGLSYQTEKWVWDAAFIWAKAEETAEAGQYSYNHDTNKRFLADYSQQDDLGYEVDVNFTYHWNHEIKIGGAFGYLFTGDYFAYTNSATPNSVDNSYVMQLKSSISF